MTTLDYYNAHADDFVKQTKNVDFHVIQDEFLKEIRKGGLILDLGCGSGRDTKYFLEHGYRVDAVDGSASICAAASAYTGIAVRKMCFLDLHEKERYDGIWACASILHLEKRQLPQMFVKMKDALKSDGVLYASFKYGDFEGYRNERYFTDLDEASLAEIVHQAEGFVIRRLWITADVRSDRKEQKWINIILHKC